MSESKSPCSCDDSSVFYMEIVNFIRNTDSYFKIQKDGAVGWFWASFTICQILSVLSHSQSVGFVLDRVSPFV